jgi:hypothetical protein
MKPRPTKTSQILLLAVALMSCLMAILPQQAIAQSVLQSMVVTPQPPRMAVFPNHPSKAGVVITSSIVGLRIDSNLGIVDDRSEPGTGEYRVVIEPSRQSLYIDAPGFRRLTYQTGNLNPRDVIYLSVEPEVRSITDTGRLLIVTQPAGATITIAGIPGSFTSPHLYESIIAQNHSVTVELSDHKPINRLVRVEANKLTEEVFSLIPTFGFLQVTADNTQLFLQTDDMPEPSRHSFTRGQPFRLDVGTYNYRLVQPFHKEITGSVTIEPGKTTRLAPVFQPDFAELRVRTNVNGFRLSTRDNNAPAQVANNMVYLEPGFREVQVTAPGFETVILNLRVVSGTTIDTTVTLVSLEEIRRRRELEALPPGILQVRSDLNDAQIFINGELSGQGSTSVSLVPGRHTVEYRHAVGRRREVIEISSAEFVSRTAVLRPSRSRAVFLGTVIPGSGHLYTKRKRGYVYFGLAAAAAGFTYYSHDRLLDFETQYDEAMDVYRSKDNFADAAVARAQAERIFDRKNESFDHRLIGLGVFAGVYALQLVDVMVTRPRYGYRERASLAIVPGVNRDLAVKLTIEF